MVVDGSTGIVVPEGELDPMVEAVDRLLVDPDLRVTMGAAARAYCQEHFSLEAVGAIWLTLLEPLLVGRVGGRGR